MSEEQTKPAEAAEEKPPFEIGVRDGAPFIRCNTCGMESFHPKDIEHRYCGKCYVFHDIPEGHEPWRPVIVPALWIVAAMGASAAGGALLGLI